MFTQRHKKLLFPLLVFSLISLIGFSWSLVGVFKEVDQAFSTQTEFVPTRIYSDLIRIAPPIPRRAVEDILKERHYNYNAQSARLTFKMHGQTHEFPRDLLPKGHPQGALPLESDITLSFDGNKASDELQSISAGDTELPELFLDPLLVSTYSSESLHEIRHVVPFAEFPKPLWKAIISIEDQHFMEHNGLDPKGLLRALWVNLRTRSFAQGGSTLTQQLVKNLTERRGKNLLKKMNEAALSLLLEIRYNKEQILERYLNEVYLGQVGSLEIHGVAEGARYFFGKQLSELHLGEMALLAGLIRGPGFYSPYKHADRAQERKLRVLQRMVDTGNATQAEAQTAGRLPIRFLPAPQPTQNAFFFVDTVKLELKRLLTGQMDDETLARAGYRVYTTLDPLLNRFAQESLQKGLLNYPKLEGVLFTVEQSTGKIRALIGGKNPNASTFNRALWMRRQVGSTFKPIVVLSALLQDKSKERDLVFGGGTPLSNHPWTLFYDHDRQQWSPHNYEKSAAEWVTLRHAIAHSLNIPIARLGVEVGIDSVIKTARALKISSELPPVPSLSLGSAELTPLELLRVYTIFANMGHDQELYTIQMVLDQKGEKIAHFEPRSERVFPAGPVELLTDFLQTVFNEGTARSAHQLGWSRPSAGKTGTTSDYQDTWFIGYTPQYTTLVWSGFDQNTLAQEKLTGTKIALPIWVEVMKRAHRFEPELPFPVPTELSEVRIDLHSGQRAPIDCPETQTRIEKYLSSREPDQTRCDSKYKEPDKIQHKDLE